MGTRSLRPNAFKIFRISAKFIVLALILLLDLAAWTAPASASSGFTEIYAGSLTPVYESAAALGDYDNDGRYDVVATGLDSFNFPSSKIYNNTGIGFTEAFAGALSSVSSGAVAWNDYDNDGDLDLMLTGSAGGPKVAKLYRNNGLTMTEVFAGSFDAVSGGSTAWGDYNNDGKSDMLLTGFAGSGRVSHIYKNTGSGFVEEFAGSLDGIRLGTAAWGDYDKDGDQDILLAGETTLGRIAKIYRNTGTGFTEAFAGSMTGVSRASAAWGDYDNDGSLDVVLTGDSGAGRIAKIYHNTGPTLTEVYAGQLTPVLRSSVAWGDHDNDGKLDIILTGDSATGKVAKVYRNTGSGFTELYAGTLAVVSDSSIALGDIEDDKDIDLILTGAGALGATSKIYQNNSSTADTVPAAPTGLSVAVTGTQATLSWNKATDTETPQNGLMYNLRVGTTPNGVDIISPMSNVTSGQRKLPTLGSVNAATSFVLKNLTPGVTYYWSVQAIDTALIGSPFATQGSFQLDVTPPSAPDLHGFWDGSSLKLYWTESTDNVGVTGYRVKNRTTTLGTTTARTWTLNGITSADAYIEAFDAASNDSADSDHFFLNTTFPGLTPVSTDVSVSPTSLFSVTYPSVTASGMTSVSVSSTGLEEPEGYDLHGNRYEIDTTATYSAPLKVCMKITLGDFSDPSNATLFHYIGGGWQNITTEVDIVNGFVCGTTDGFSEFAVGEPEAVVLPSTGRNISYVLMFSLAMIFSGAGMLARRTKRSAASSLAAR